jgi:hypothetical protein
MGARAGAFKAARISVSIIKREHIVIADLLMFAKCAA